MQHLYYNFFRKVITHPFPKSVCLTVRPGKNVMNVFSRDMGIKSRSFLSLHKTRLLYSFTHIIPSLEILPPKPRAIIPLLQVIQWNPSTNNGQATLQSCILVSVVLVFFFYFALWSVLISTNEPEVCIMKKMCVISVLNKVFNSSYSVGGVLFSYL